MRRGRDWRGQEVKLEVKRHCNICGSQIRPRAPNWTCKHQIPVKNKSSSPTALCVVSAGIWRTTGLEGQDQLKRRRFCGFWNDRAIREWQLEDLRRWE